MSRVITDKELKVRKLKIKIIDAMLDSTHASQSIGFVANDKKSFYKAIDDERKAVNIVYGLLDELVKEALNEDN